MARRPRVSPDRILAAAADEFAERGFAGARVDRIARRARVNKAMLYYHFRSKQELYRTLLRRHFTLAADRLRAIAAGVGGVEASDHVAGTDAVALGNAQLDHASSNLGGDAHVGRLDLTGGANAVGRRLAPAGRGQQRRRQHPEAQRPTGREE